MHFVILGVHSPEICPTSNTKTRELLLQTAPLIPKAAEQTGVKIVAGPYVNREHTTVVVVESQSAEELDRFLMETRLPQWNSVRILPSLSMEQALRETQELPALF